LHNYFNKYSYKVNKEKRFKGRIGYINKKKSVKFISFLLLFNIILISLITSSFLNFNRLLNDFNDGIDDSPSVPNISSSDPPNKHFFQNYKVITIDHNLVSGTGSHKNFPVLISILDSDLRNEVQSNGNDIAFANDTAWLDHEIELFDQSFNETYAKLVAWVCIPSLSTNTNTLITMYYGNSTMSSQQNPTGVWDSNYEAVWHMNQDPSSSNILDSTSNNNDLNTNGFASDQRIYNGKVGTAITFDGINDYLNISSFSGPTDGFTFQSWFKFDDEYNASRSEMYLFSGSTAGRNNPRVRFYPGGGYTVGSVATTTDENDSCDGVKNVWAADTWFHYAFRFSIPIQTTTIYINSTVDGFKDDADLSYPHLAWNRLTIGSNDGTNVWGSGAISEFRVVNIPLSVDWINTEYNNQYNPYAFYSIGKEYTVSGIPPDEQYFKCYKEIIINHTMVSGSLDLINFPLLISIFDSDLRYDVQLNGDDIAFAYNGAWLDHEIELFNQTFNSTDAQLITWVCIPRLSTSLDTIIRMYYGNSTMSSREIPTEVWSNNYKGVWHLSESTGSALDSTSYSTAGSVSGTVSRDPTGKIDSAYNFGTDGQINFGDPPDGHFDMGTGSFTISFWINIDASTGNYQLPLHKGADVVSEAGYDFETDVSATSLTFHISDGTNLASTSPLSIIFDSWIYVVGVVDRTLNSIRLFQDGQIVGSGTSIAGIGNLTNNKPLLAPYSTYDLDGFLDEIRIATTAHSADWIATEYNNQYNPLSFLTIGSEEKFDFSPPTYSNLTESSDPLELGDIEVITINVSDPSGINQVKIEFMSSNDSLTNIGGDIWQYDAWIPNSVGNHTYTIWMEDNYNNWNSTIGTIEVIDTTSPTYSDIIESADPLQLGQNVTISIKAYDSPGSGVNQTLLEYGSSNHTMIFIDGNTWSWNTWKPLSSGIHPYKIFMQDMENNWNMTSGTITVVSTTAPVIENLTKSEDPLELGNSITITVDVFDNETFVWDVLIELDGVNHTMTAIGGFTYEYNWTRSYVGTIYYSVYANDTDNNWNSYSSSFDIVDTTPPAFSDLAKSEDSLEFGNTVIISVNSTDLSDINQVKIEFMGSNHSMTNISGFTWQYDSWIPNSVGNHTYTIWAEDNNNNWGFISESFLVRDTTPPIYSDLTESGNPVELGTTLIISINSTDLAYLKDVSIEYRNFNHTMTNIGDDIWQYNSWMPNSIGNYTYKIYMTDNNDNLNYVSSSIQFQDTIIPVYSNLFESTDPLELGDSAIIRIRIYDFAGINQSLLEFEGSNHSMTNIYGDTWQYDLWTPNNWILHQYTIHMKDKSGNWNFVIANITIQDTTPPPSPVLTNSPSGDVSGILVFDWSDGSDPSGISYYFLIIDNETDPFATPGFVYIFNITNSGIQSSYYELSENLNEGTYYYFLSQIDGTGHQSSYTMGTFTIVPTNNEPGNTDFLIVIIIGIIFASVAGLLLTGIIVKRRTKKEVLPQLKKISLKPIILHVDKILRSSSFLKIDTEKFKIKKEETVTLGEEHKHYDKELESRLNEIKTLGEELMDEGAYLEAFKQFELAREILSGYNRNEEAELYSELIVGIKGLIEERERRFAILEQEKVQGNSVRVYELYNELMVISEKLRDIDAIQMYQSELMQFFQDDEKKALDLEKLRDLLEKRADSLSNDNHFEESAKIYEKCENVSLFLVQLGKEEETINVKCFRDKKVDSLEKRP